MQIHVYQAFRRSDGENFLVAVDVLDDLVEDGNEYFFLSFHHLEDNERTWIKWGALLVWTNKSFIAEPCAPKPRLVNIPYIIQRTLLKIPKGYKTIYIHCEKELEKNVKLDYKDKAPILVVKQSERKDNE